MPTRQKPSREKGYFSRLNKRTGKTEHRIRISWFGAMTWFGPYRTKTEALNAIEDKNAEQRRVKQMPGEVRPTIGKLRPMLDDYVHSLTGKCEDQRSQKRFGEFWKEVFGNRPPLSLKPTDVEAELTKLHEQGLKNSTVNHYGKFLRTFMNRRVKPKSWVIDFWADITWYDPSKDKLRRTPLSVEQEDRLYHALRAIDRLYVRLGVLLGLRREQFFKLRWEWMIWDAEAPFLNLPPFKCHPERDLPIPAEASIYLRWLYEQQGRPESGWMFPQAKHPDRPQNSHNWYRRRFMVAVANADLKAVKVDFHTLRHTWATRAGQETASRIMQDLGGWTDPRMAELYTRPYDPAKRAAMERGAAVNPKAFVPTAIELLPNKGGRKGKLLKLTINQ